MPNDLQFMMQWFRYQFGINKRCLCLSSTSTLCGGVVLIFTVKITIGQMNGGLATSPSDRFSLSFFLPVWEGAQLKVMWVWMGMNHWVDALLQNPIFLRKTGKTFPQFHSFIWMNEKSAVNENKQSFILFKWNAFVLKFEIYEHISAC